MKFVTEHFTKHHLLHAPHRWFLALLLSPIHAAEVHYQKNYHLQFAHARKLFLFDMALLACIVVLIGSYAFIHFYDPTITKHITTSLSASADKIKNGEHIEYTFTYQNNSKQKLTEPTVSFTLPPGFVLDTTTPLELFDTRTKTFSLPPLPPGASGNITLGGYFFGNSDEKALVASHFSYRQDGKNILEEKVTPLFTIPRGSVLQTNIEAGENLVSGSTSEVTIQVKNTGTKPLTQVQFDLSLPKGEIQHTSIPLSGAKTWVLPAVLEPGSTTILTFDFKPETLETATTSLVITPHIQIADKTFVLDRKNEHVWNVVTPHIQFGAQLENTPLYVVPGKNLTVNFTLTNNGNIALNNAVITLPVGNTLDGKQLQALNRGTLDKTGFHISSKFIAGLTEIAPGATLNIPVEIPVKTNLEGTDVFWDIHPTLQGTLQNIEGTFTSTAFTPKIKIATRLSMDTSIRYYTLEGDQLGRGPLPPRVGKETKYAAIVRIGNTTSEVKNVRFTATLPSHIHWTGRRSSSQGKEPSFDATSNTVSWTTSALAPHSVATLFLELSLTPDASQVGTTPLVLKNIAVSGTDSFTEQNVSATFRDLDTSLPNDTIGKIKGVTVRE